MPVPALLSSAVAHDVHDEKTEEKSPGRQRWATEIPTTAHKFIVPAGLVVSGLIHLMFLTPAIVLHERALGTPPMQAVTVDIVTPEEAPSPPDEKEKTPPETPTKETADAPLTPQPERQPAHEKAQAASAPPPMLSVLPPPRFLSPQQPESPPATVAPQSEPAAMSGLSAFAMPMTMPDGTIGDRIDTQAADRAKIANDAVTAFRAQLKTCSKPPIGIASNVRVVVRIYLMPDGTLVQGLPANPKAIKVDGVSVGGGVLYENAVHALRQCQPYRMLPADQYEEWRTLDMTFTPQNF